MTRLFSWSQLPVRADSNLSFVMISNGRWNWRFHFILPLLGKVAGANDHATLEIAANTEFLRQQPAHDGLAGAGIVRQKKAERLAGQHLFIDGRDLVRERLDQGGVDRQERVEEVGQTDAMGLGDQAEHGPVAVEAPRASRRDDFQGRLAVAIDQFVAEATGGIFVGKLDGHRTDPLHVHDGNQAVREYPLDRGVFGQSLKLSHDSGSMEFGSNDRHSLNPRRVSSLRPFWVAQPQSFAARPKLVMLTSNGRAMAPRFLTVLLRFRMGCTRQGPFQGASTSQVRENPDFTPAEMAMQ